MTKSITVYLDTNVLRDVMSRRNKDSTFWMERIKEKKWKCITSIFGITELLDIEQDHIFINRQLSRKQDFEHIFRDKHHRDLESTEFQTAKESVENFLDTYNIEYVYLDEEGWKLLLHIVANSNLFSPDAIHLASAWRNNADLIITSDSHFINHAIKLLESENVKTKLRICNPQQVRNMLKTMRIGGI